MSGSFGWTELFLILTLLYFLPSIVAFVRKHPSKWKIFALCLVLFVLSLPLSIVNYLFFLLTFIGGWISALVWACKRFNSAPQREPNILKQG